MVNLKVIGSGEPLAEGDGDIFALRAHLQSLQIERDSCRTLVDITNTLLTLSSPGELPAALFPLLQPAFGQIALTLVHEEQPAGRFSSYLCTAQQKMQAMACQHHCDSRCCLGNQPGNRPRLLARDPGTVCRHPCSFHPQLHPASTASTASTLVAPLYYRGKARGMLCLARPSTAEPDEQARQLLEQIAARCAMTLEKMQTEPSPPQPQEALTRLGPQAGAGDLPEIIYRSPAMAHVIQQIRLVAASGSSVLLLGETGTGKELAARAIHHLSQRQKDRMISLNCAAIPGELLESDLFGHEKGAFTGAQAQRTGKFERAHRGTLFLDEIGDMPLALQPKLLRVLQEQQLERIGGTSTIAVDVRVIAATHCDLPTLIREKRFRSDLYYRLNVFPIELPPLRERREDIPLLVNHFIRKIAGRMGRTITALPAGTMERLMAQPWPGNIRELENVIERAVIMTRTEVLNLPAESLPMPIPCRYEEAKSPRPDHETREILEALRLCNGIVAGERGAAKRLGIKRTTLLSRMKRLGIAPRQLSEPGEQGELGHVC